MEEKYNELKLFSRSEAAEAMSIGRDALSTLIKEGKIGILQIGDRWMISYKEIQKYIEQNTIKANQLEEEKVDLEAFRISNDSKSNFDSKVLLTKIMEKENVKYIS